MDEEKTTQKKSRRFQTEQLKKMFFSADVLGWIIIGLVGFAILILTFGVGVKVGVSKARYSYRWAENYHRNFGGHQGGFLGDLINFPQGEFINAHGVFGSIIKIDGNTVIAKAKDDV